MILNALKSVKKVSALRFMYGDENHAFRPKDNISKEEMTAEAGVRKAPKTQKGSQIEVLFGFLKTFLNSIYKVILLNLCCRHEVFLFNDIIQIHLIFCFLHRFYYVFTFI